MLAPRGHWVDLPEYRPSWASSSFRKILVLTPMGHPSGLSLEALGDLQLWKSGRRGGWGFWSAQTRAAFPEGFADRAVMAERGRDPCGSPCCHSPTLCPVAAPAGGTVTSSWAFVPAKQPSQHLSLARLYFPGAAPPGPGLVEEVPSASLQPRLSLHFHHRGQNCHQ